MELSAGAVGAMSIGVWVIGFVMGIAVASRSAVVYEKHIIWPMRQHYLDLKAVVPIGEEEDEE